jgi:phosphotriesterase-related protein
VVELPPVPHRATDELKKAGANMAKPTIGVHSGLVRTVLGPIPVEAMGVTLLHEHILLDASSWWKRPCCGSEIAIAETPLDISMIGDLRMNPFLNRDNCGLLDVRAAIEELNHFVEYGGKTIVDPTNLGIGRDPSALQRISRRTGLNIVMGAGFYLEPSHPPYVKDMTVEMIGEVIARDCGLSEDEPEVCAGIIGEIGISKDFTSAEEKVLRGAARASKLSGAPLSVHLPGWERHAHRVLDVVESEGADLRHVVLCHMNPSLHDPQYQKSVADRGAFIEYDMIGMDFFYADQQAQSPSDEENAIAICRLVDDGYLNSVLMSQDVFLKMMLVRYGGFGYGYILKHFVPRLKRHGMDQRTIDAILIENPRRVFSAEHRAR